LDLGNEKNLGSPSGCYSLLEISVIFTAVTSFGFSEADTQLVGVVLQSIDAVVHETNAVVVKVRAVAAVTADVVVAADLAVSGW
jgi:hypothetical protein